jgi:ribonuclease BN (tRNA processing enzyme)
MVRPVQHIMSEAPDRTRIVLLGTGTPNADPDRFGPSVAIVVDGVPYLIDCGAGVVRRAAAAHRLGVSGLQASNLRYLFITHLHSDHTIGYADVIFTPWVLERDVPLKVFGPRGTQRMTDHILAAYDEDIHLRLDGLEPTNSDGYKVEVHEIDPGVIYTDERVTVSAFPVRHGSWKYAYGFRFETPDRAIVVSGDTAPSPQLIEQARGCDVLIHEVYAQAGFEKREPVWQRYHLRFHTSAPQLAEIANQVRPGLLILYHQLFWGTTEVELLEEIRREYRGPVVSGHDLDVF